MIMVRERGKVKRGMLSKINSPGSSLRGYRCFVGEYCLHGPRASIVSPTERSVKGTFRGCGERLHGGRQTRTAVADGPLTGFADRVQYPLETPSRHGLQCKLYGLIQVRSVL
jgi:hypothetical protein